MTRDPADAEARTLAKYAVTTIATPDEYAALHRYLQRPGGRAGCTCQWTSDHAIYTRAGRRAAHDEHVTQERTTGRK